jgi:copper transporter 1
MVAIVALGAFYEWLRAYSSVVDRQIARRMIASGKGKARHPASGRSTPEAETNEEAGLLDGLKGYKAM